MGTIAKITPTELDGVFIIESHPNVDNRGFFMRLFCQQELKELIEDRTIVQINYSITTKKGAIRGLHYQNPPNAEMKIVRCLRGKVWDVAVDLRRNSKTFLKWHAEELSPEKNNMIVIPEGFAHGFQVLETNSELLYLHTAYYAPDSEGALRYDDPVLNITWPLEVTDISDKDKKNRLIDDNFTGIVI